MNTDTAFEKFTTMEADLDLFDRQVKGVYIWQRIRNAVFREVEQQTKVSEESDSSRTAGNGQSSFFDSQINRGKLLYYSALGLTVQNPLFAGQTDIIFKGNPPYRRELQSDGMWWDIICDPVMAHLTRDYFNIDSGFQLQMEGVTPVKTDNVKYLDHVTVLYQLKNRLGLNDLSLTETERKLITDVRNRTETEFDVGIDIEPIIKTELKYRKTTKPFYNRLLERVDPKAIVLTYNPGSTTLVEVSKQKRVPVIELQHGMITEYQPTYSYPHPHSQNELFPDYLFVFGEMWRDSVEYPIDDDHVIPVGYPHIEQKYNEYAETRKKDQIVFLSQYIIGESLSKFASEFANQHDSYHVVYKLHPNEYDSWRVDYPWLTESDIEVVDDPAESLHRLLAESKIQIGVVSTALYEGLNYHLETYLVDLPGIERMNYLTENDYATVVTSVHDLENEINKDKKRSRQINPELVFKRKSIENIIEAIDEVITRHS